MNKNVTIYSLINNVLFCNKDLEKERKGMFIGQKKG